MTPPTFSHNSHSSHKSHNSQPCVAHLCLRAAVVIKQLVGRLRTLPPITPTPKHPQLPSNVRGLAAVVMLFANSRSYSSYSSYKSYLSPAPPRPACYGRSTPALHSPITQTPQQTQTAIQNTKTPACTLAHTQRTRARALGAKNAKKTRIFAFFCSKSFDKSILDDILCLVLRLLSSGDNKTG